MRLWLDTEFNEFGGELISMALVAEDDREWYEVLPCADPKPWVAKHVMPILSKEPLASREELSRSLQKFCAGFATLEIIADYPDDIAHFCAALVVGPGKMLIIPALKFVLRTDLENTADVSTCPHNALADAYALRSLFLNEEAANGKLVGDEFERVFGGEPGRVMLTNPPSAWDVWNSRQEGFAACANIAMERHRVAAQRLDSLSRALISHTNIINDAMEAHYPEDCMTYKGSLSELAAEKIKRCHALELEKAEAANEVH